MRLGCMDSGRLSLAAQRQKNYYAKAQRLKDSKDFAPLSLRVFAF